MPEQPELPLRIVVDGPTPGVRLRLQRGRGELVEPASETASEVAFDFTVRVDLSRGAPNFLGPFTQGTPAARFVYVCIGQNAGQHDSPWSRRAKIPLTDISAAQVKETLAKGGRLEVHYAGQGRNGPTCATVRLPPGAWQLRGGRK
jgi:hypothetical protein